MYCHNNVFFQTLRCLIELLWMNNQLIQFFFQWEKTVGISCDVEIEIEYLNVDEKNQVAASTKSSVWEEKGSFVFNYL